MALSRKAVVRTPLRQAVASLVIALMSAVFVVGVLRRVVRETVFVGSIESLIEFLMLFLIVAFGVSTLAIGLFRFAFRSREAIAADRVTPHERRVKLLWSRMPLWRRWGGSVVIVISGLPLFLLLVLLDPSANWTMSELSAVCVGALIALSIGARLVRWCWRPYLDGVRELELRTARKAHGPS